MEETIMGVQVHLVVAHVHLLAMAHRHHQAVQAALLVVRQDVPVPVEVVAHLHVVAAAHLRVAADVLPLAEVAALLTVLQVVQVHRNLRDVHLVLIHVAVSVLRPVPTIVVKTAPMDAVQDVTTVVKIAATALVALLV